MQDGYWAIRKYTAGPIGEAYKIWVPGKKPARMTASAKAGIRKQAQNAQNAVKTLARLLNENFRAGDYLLGLDYDEESYKRLEEKATEWLLTTSDTDGSLDFDRDDKEGEQVMALWHVAKEELLGRGLKRIKYHAQKNGVDIKFAAVTSDLDEKTGEVVRVHHHLVVNREAKEYFEKHWKKGGVSWEMLTAQPDYTGIAVYLLAQVRHVEDAKKYTTSRKNLVRPQPEDRIAKSAAIIRAPKGAVLLDAGKNIPGQPQYIRYILPDQVLTAEQHVKNGAVIVRAVDLHRRKETAPATVCGWGQKGGTDEI